jgi:hypothetical protein
MRHLILGIATWVLSRLAHAQDRESLVGDLTEEHVARANATSASAAFKWQLRQVCASISPLLWSRLTRATWISTLGVALVAYIGVGVVEFTANWAILRALPGTRTYTPLELIVTVPAVVLIGYFAARFSRGAAALLGVMMLLVVTAMLLLSTEHMPLWYRMVYFCVGPASAFMGGRLRAATEGKDLASFPPP